MRWSRALYVVLILVVLVFLYGLFIVRNDSSEVVDISKVAELANKGQVESITIDQNEVTAMLDDGTQLTSYKEPDVGITETLSKMGVSSDQLANIKVTVAPRSAWEGWLTILGTLLPLILIGGFFFFILRQAQGAGNQALSFGKSRARMFTGAKPTVTLGWMVPVFKATMLQQLPKWRLCCCFAWPHSAEHETDF